MIFRIFALLLASVLTVAASKNPFVDKFGGPYRAVGKDFKEAIVQYGMMWSSMYSMLGKAALQDADGLDEFFKTEVDTRLDKIKPSTPEEEKMKAAAIYLKTLYEAQMRPSKFDKAQLAEFDKFLIASAPPDKAGSDKVAAAILNFRLFSLGLSADEVKKIQQQ